MPDQRDGQQTGTGTGGNEQVRQGKKNVSVEPPPELAEHGGIEPKERDPSKYHDRTRDRELEEG